jgi:hypothetical protein
MVKDISFLKSGYDELIAAIRLIDIEIAEQKKILYELEAKRNHGGRNLKTKINEELLRAIEDDTVRSFLSLSVYGSKGFGEEFGLLGSMIGILHQLHVSEKEIRLGDIWGSGDYRFMFVKIEDLRALGLKPTKLGLKKILSKILVESSCNIMIELSEAIEKEEGYILLKGCNRFKSKIAIN